MKHVLAITLFIWPVLRAVALSRGLLKVCASFKGLLLSPFGDKLAPTFFGQTTSTVIWFASKCHDMQSVHVYILKSLTQIAEDVAFFRTPDATTKSVWLNTRPALFIITSH